MDKLQTLSRQDRSRLACRIRGFPLRRSLKPIGRIDGSIYMRFATLPRILYIDHPSINTLFLRALHVTERTMLFVTLACVFAGLATSVCVFYRLTLLFAHQ